jgi:hypothetical protein
MGNTAAGRAPTRHASPAVCPGCTVVRFAAEWILAAQQGGFRARTLRLGPQALAGQAGSATEETMSHATHTEQHFANFAQFYPFYLSEHSNLMSRRLHFVGSLGVIGCIAMAIATGNWLWLPAAVVCGYGFAWVGHFVFEKNRPATFRHPIYSLMGDWVMFSDICRGKISL